uniref:Uncharacterized protein n=1 Tax=Siphoviridae sp. ct7EW56 TaxID=2827562 RepID=A0A8S5LS70_9CAUD|nr:MAG TPA: hypothetical protein [Siphoviridae sp. ct7EW56]
MRVISQSGTMDFPYDNSLVFLHESRIKGNTCVEIQLYGGTEIDTVAEYSTKEKALKAMAMLREAYCNNEFYHHTATTNTFREAMGILSSEKLKEVTSEYFQFPQDEEIEV